MQESKVKHSIMICAYYVKLLKSAVVLEPASRIESVLFSLELFKLLSSSGQVFKRSFFDDVSLQKLHHSLHAGLHIANLA